MYVPQRGVSDRVVWANSSNSLYTTKITYHFWYEAHFGTSTIPQCTGWKRVWHLQIPHKIKVFIWHFCRNVMPVRNRLSLKGIRVPKTCPMCVCDIEHMIHLFYDCSFAVECLHHVVLSYNWSIVESAHEWLLYKLNTATTEEPNKICVTL